MSRAEKAQPGLQVKGEQTAAELAARFEVHHHSKHGIP